MKEKEFYCISCGGFMRAKETLTPHITRTGRKCRKRRFVCDCGYEEVIYADGTIDTEWTPQQAVDAVNKLHKQQERNEKS